MGGFVKEFSLINKQNKIPILRARLWSEGDLNLVDLLNYELVIIHDHTVTGLALLQKKSFTEIQMKL